VWQFFFLYILSLLAGKFEKICTAFTLATFFGKKMNGTLFENFWSQKIFRVSSTILNSPKEHAPFRATKSTNFGFKSKAAFTRQTNVCQLALTNSNWCVWTTRQHVGTLLGRIEISSICCQQFANKLLCHSHTPIWVCQRDTTLVWHVKAALCSHWRTDKLISCTKCCIHRGY